MIIINSVKMNICQLQVTHKHGHLTDDSILYAQPVVEEVLRYFTLVKLSQNTPLQVKVLNSLCCICKSSFIRSIISKMYLKYEKKYLFMQSGFF